MFDPPYTSSEPSARSPLRKRVIGIAELYASANAGEMLVTYALGSCLGITMHDPAARVGGLLHAMLPSSTLNLQRAATAPGTFVDAGIVALLEACLHLGARRSRLIVTVAGGAAYGDDEQTDTFQIGRRNLLELRRLLPRHGLPLHASDVGGRFSRNVSLAIDTGEVRVSRHVKTPLGMMA